MASLTLLSAETALRRRCAMTATRALRPSTRGSKVWWSSSRAMDELYDTWTLEPSWHASQRQLQLDKAGALDRQDFDRTTG